MKQRIYLRVTKGGMVSASTKPNYKSLPDSEFPIPKPTVLIALDLNIPDSEFEASRILLEANIKSSQPAVEIKQAGASKIKQQGEVIPYQEFKETRGGEHE